LFKATVVDGRYSYQETTDQPVRQTVEVGCLLMRAAR